jgi:hypothetical protein
MNCDSDMCGNPAGALDTTTAENGETAAESSGVIHACGKVDL